ncbi:antibiotic biosynthesis monooxygenase [Streptomyces fragilis]|uniref:Antibiotic biosynthesis monooxygenase n=1 Tax=Streptomyces fragilis TaxID=67301 RepID=A0ABV2YFJ1_9ACTN|nr:antibiotic biosynthesis monooxygenase [Streptomyces fragilis]
MSAVIPQKAGFAAFHVFGVRRPAAAGRLGAVLAEAVAERLPRRPGFVSARVHRTTDDTRVVTRILWRDRKDHAAAVEDGVLPAALREGGRGPGNRPVVEFLGTPVPGITGPQEGEPPGVVAVATRHLRDGASFHSLMGLLERSEEWKRHHPGFIRATPYRGLDGVTFVNYPEWADEESYRAWMADPRLPRGQEEIARLEAARPEYLLCTVTAHIDAEEVRA